MNPFSLHIPKFDRQFYLWIVLEVHTKSQLAPTLGMPKNFNSLVYDEYNLFIIIDVKIYR